MAQFQRPRGTRDFGPEEMKDRKWVEKRMRKAIGSFGYEEVSTPTFEHTDLFVARSGPQVIEQIYSFTDKGGREIALRPELTAPVMRFYNSDMRKHPKPIRIFYFGNCFRYERPQKGRYREFWQMGLEYIGKRSPLALSEVVAAAIAALDAVGLQGYTVRIGHVALLASILRHHGADPDKDKDLMIAIDKKDKNSIIDHLRKLGDSDPEPLVKFVTELYNIDTYGNVLYSLGRSNEGLIPFITEIKEVLDTLMRLDANIKFDPSISRGLDYYDSLVFEIDAPKLGAEKQICGGGAYSLSSVFGSEVEGIGFGLGFDRIIVALDEIPSDEDLEKSVYIMPIGNGAKEKLFQLANEIRRNGRVCIFETSDRNFKKVINSAVTKGCSHLIVMGEDELKKGTISVKDLITKEQEEVPIDMIMDHI